MMIMMRRIFVGLLFVGLFCSFESVIGVANRHDKQLQRYGLKSSHDHVHIVKEFVDYYSACVKSNVETKLTNNSTIEKELKHLTYYLHSSQSVGKSATFLARVSSVHKRVMDQNLPDEKRKIANEVISAAMLRCSLLLADTVRTQLLETLYIVDNYLSYWREQRGRTMHYFFHKSPHKWFMGQTQKSEIRDTIYMLERLQEKLYYDLGMLAGHMCAFVPEDSVENFYRWVDRLCLLVPLYNSTDEQPQDFVERIIQNLQYKITHVGNIKNDIVTLISSAKKPNHFVRNWMMYAGLCGVAYAAYKNPNVVEELVGFNALNGYAVSIKKLFKDNIVDPIEKAIDLLRGKDIEHKKQMKNIEDTNAIIDKKMAELKKILPSLNSNGGEDIKILQRNVTKSVEGSLHAVLKALQCDQAKQETIMSAIKKGNFSKMSDYLDELSKRPTEAWSIAGKVDEHLPQLKGYAFTAEGNIVPGLLKLLQQYVVAIDEGILPATHDTVELIIAVADLIKGCSQDYYDVKKQTRLIAQLLLLMPVGLATWSFAKVYNWMSTHDYRSLRVSLAEVQSFFIETVSPLSPNDYGKLIFLLHKLKRQAIMHISTRDKLQHDFLVDITKLESTEFDNKTKRLIVENMRSRYPFLSVT